MKIIKKVQEWNLLKEKKELCWQNEAHNS
jgi:hypothetical protein